MGLSGVLEYSKMNTVTGVENADPHRLIQMLLDGAIEKINKAKFFMKNGEFSEKGSHISWAISIIGGLQSSLDMEKGGNLSENLNGLYQFSIEHLLKANINNDEQKLDEVLAIMLEIKEGWDNIRQEVAPQWQQNN